MRGMSATLYITEHGTGSPVLLLHGQPGTGAIWEPVADELAADYRVLVPDRIGNGRTGGEGRGCADNADLVAELLQAKNAAPATVVGHSWGGGVAILLTARHPEFVQSLVLVGSVGTADTVNGLDHLLTVHGVGDALTVAGLMAMGSVLPRVRHWTPRLPGTVGEYLDAVLPDEQLTEGLEGAWGRTMRTFMIEQRALMTEIGDMERAMPSVHVPTAVVSGEWDLVVPPRSADTMARTIPDAELVRMARVGHFIPRDAPHALAEVIRATHHRAPEHRARQ